MFPCTPRVLFGSFVLFFIYILLFINQKKKKKKARVFSTIEVATVGEQKQHNDN